MNKIMSFIKKPWVLVAIAVVATLAYGNRLPAVVRANAKKLPGATA